MNNKIKNIVSIALVAIFSVIVNSCENPVAEVPLRSPDGKTPIVTGLRVTSEKSPDLIDTWGFPNDPQIILLPPMPPRSVQIEPANAQRVINPIPVRFFAANPYPNPMKNRISIEFQIPYATKVNIWMVPAKLATDLSTQSSFVNTSGTLQDEGIAISELIRENYLQAGYYRVDWDRNDRYGRKAKQGFYRVYIQVSSDIFWRDILIWDDESFDPKQFFPNPKN